MEDHFTEEQSLKSQNASIEASRSPGRILAYVSVPVLFVFLVWMYSGTIVSMIQIWYRSDTFSHGFAIFPISAYLIWRSRGNWLHQPIRPSLFGFVLLLFLVVGWFVSSLANIQVGQQLAVTGMFGGIVLTILGASVAREMCFPLLFANFAAPFGSFLVPSLMEWTAAFTVWAVNLSGIPVFREGMNFSLPSGSFSVIAACAGARYLLVTVVIGALFSNIVYKDWRRRVVFMTATIVLPIMANGIRAYSIVLIAHYSDFRYGTGNEHFIVGWIIFAVLILVLFMIGLRFSDSTSPKLYSKGSRQADLGEVEDSKSPTISLVSGTVLLLLVVAPYYIEKIQVAEYQATRSPNLPVAGGDWFGPTAGSVGAYYPINKGAAVSLAVIYEGYGGQVGVHEFVYQNERQGVELVSWHNELFDSDRWIVRHESEVLVNLTDAADIEIQSTLIVDRRRGSTVLVWSWYDLNGIQTSSKYVAKFQEALQRATLRNEVSAQIILVTHIEEYEVIEAQNRLKVFVRDYAKHLSICLKSDLHDDDCVKPSRDMYSK